MAISGIDQYGGLLNSYAYQNIKSVDLNTVKAQDEANAIAQKQSNSIAGLAESYANTELNNIRMTDNRSRIANLEDISLSFNLNEDYGYLGKDAEIGQLDMEQAISDMRKDNMLQEYQFFVGGQDNIMADSEDGMVIRK